MSAKVRGERSANVRGESPRMSTEKSAKVRGKSPRMSAVTLRECPLMSAVNCPRWKSANVRECPRQIVRECPRQIVRECPRRTVHLCPADSQIFFESAKVRESPPTFHHLFLKLIMTNFQINYDKFSLLKNRPRVSA